MNKIDETDIKDEIKKYGLNIMYYNVLSDVYKDFIINIIKDKKNINKKLIIENAKLKKKVEIIEKDFKIEKDKSLEVIKRNKELKTLLIKNEEQVEYYKKKYYHYKDINIIKDLKVKQNEEELKLLKLKSDDLKKKVEELEKQNKNINNNKRLCVHDEDGDKKRYKTRLCRHLGKCLYRDKCNFAHDLNEIKYVKCINGLLCFNEKCEYFHPEEWNPTNNKILCTDCKDNKCDKTNKKYIHC